MLIVTFVSDCWLGLSRTNQGCSGTCLPCPAESKSLPPTSLERLAVWRWLFGATVRHEERREVCRWTSWAVDTLLARCSTPSIPRRPVRISINNDAGCVRAFQSANAVVAGGAS
ncbi:unnamed protein product [Polarella glacialis]|uniref:Uncharacterized protein n=1 Tax=Polarella glacialis TaxID=89957 RepID=A0A813KXD9_POLGL|nr:unnamed protein product [Polarella glacialis]CAE8736483.1 unnamed protein product [Polarella glacialis]